MVGELGHHFLRHPWGARLDVDVHSLDVGRLHTFQGFDVRGECRIALGRLAGLGQLRLHVPAQVLVAGDVALHRVLIDEVAKLLDDGVRRLAVQLAHQVEVYAAGLGEAGDQGVLRRRGAGRRLIRLLGALAEDRRLLRARLASLLAGLLRHGGGQPLVEVVLQGGELRPRRIVAEQALVGVEVDRAVRLDEGVIGRVQLLAGGLDPLVGGARVQLQAAQAGQHVADADHADDALAGLLVREGHGLGGVLAQHVLAAHLHGVAVEEHGADAHVLGAHGLGGLRLHRRRLGHDALGQAVDGARQLGLGVLALAGDQGGLAVAVHGAVGAEVAEHHFRVAVEILVQRNGVAVLVGVVAHLHPALAGWLLALGAAAHEDDVRGHGRAGVRHEGVVRQADRAQEVGAVGHVAACLVARHVHHAVGHDHGQHAAGAQAVQALGEEIVVDTEAAQVLAATVVQALAAERRVADGDIEVAVRDQVVLIAHAGDLRLGIELGGDSAGDVVQLHAVQRGGLAQLVRHQAEEVAGADRRLQHPATVEAQAGHGAPHGAHDLRRGVVGVLRGGCGGAVFVGGQQALQLADLAIPALAGAAVAALEGLRDAAPADVFRQDRLLVGGGGAALGLQLLQQADRRDVVPVFGLGAALADLVGLGDGVVRRALLGDDAPRRCYAARLSITPSSGSGWITCIASLNSAPVAASSASVCSCGGNRYSSLVASQASCVVIPAASSSLISACVRSAASRRAFPSWFLACSSLYRFGRCSFQCSRAWLIQLFRFIRDLHGRAAHLRGNAAGLLHDHSSQVGGGKVHRRPAVRCGRGEAVAGLAGHAEHHLHAAGRGRDDAAQRAAADGDIGVGAGLRVAHGQGHVAANGDTGLVLRDRLLQAPLLVLVRHETVGLQHVGHGAQVGGRVLQERLFGLLALVGVAVDVIDAEILGQRAVGRGAGLHGALPGLLHLGAERAGLLLRQLAVQLGMLARGVFHAGHALGVEARIVPGALPKAQQVRLDLVAEVIGHQLGVLAEAAHAGLDVGAGDGHAVDQHLWIDAAVQLAHLRLQAGAGGGHLVGGEQLVVGEDVGGRLALGRGSAYILRCAGLAASCVIREFRSGGVRPSVTTGVFHLIGRQQPSLRIPVPGQPHDCRARLVAQADAVLPSLGVILR
ncbi:hypothetical protein [Pseudomonas phage Itty13]|uniref:Uncharacterized protein n=1 Tax=Pseudomonas phage Itty13 TaxID=2805750 RepID=A0A889IS48_9CAUD|nr:hypothetical protein PQC19_gp02 [Pseudomonas phage Itty13]QRE00578.1 hypothetical protein [Pseudomonas phage Itty13]